MSTTHISPGWGPAMRASWIVFAVFILSNAATPLYAHWQQQMGFRASVLTIIFSLYILGLILTLASAGQFADHYGRRAVLVPCGLLAAAAAGLFIAADAVSMLMLARFITGMAVGLVLAAGMATVVEQAPPAKSDSAALLASIAMVGGAGGGPLLAGLSARYAGSPLLLTFGLVLGCLGLAMLVIINLPHRRLGQGRMRLRFPSLPREHWLTVGLGVAFFGPGITATSFVLSLGPSVLDGLMHAHNPLAAGFMACGMFLSAVSAQLLLRQLPVRSLFFISGSLTAGAMICVLAASTFGIAGLMILCAICAGAGQGLGQLGGLRLIAAYMPLNRRAEGNALFNLAGYVPAGILPVLTGYWADTRGFAIALGIFAGVLLCALIGSMLLLAGSHSRLKRLVRV